MITAVFCLLLSGVRMKARIACSLLVACGCSQQAKHDIEPAQQRQRAALHSGVTRIHDVTRDEIAAADLSILFIGNSHSDVLPQVFSSIATRHDRDLDIVATRADASTFLANHARTQSTPKAIATGPWDFVVLQALKYSTSGEFQYPYDGAIAITQLANDNGSQVVMFPEWGRRGFPDEAARIQRIHEEVVATTGAIVAPVGLAWDRALGERPQLQLHHADGNHASQLGDYLTANVIYAGVTGHDPRLAADSPDVSPAALPSATPETRRFLERIAWETVQDHRPAQ